MRSFKPKNSKKIKRRGKKKGGVGKPDPRALHQQKPSMSDLIADAVSKKKKGQL